MKQTEEPIERLEKEGPSRELDARLAQIVGINTGAFIWDTKGNFVCVNNNVLIPKDTSSIDATLTLVSEGLYWEVHQDNCVLIRGPGDHDYIGWRAASPGIALRIAALSVLASKDGRG